MSSDDPAPVPPRKRTSINAVVPPPADAKYLTFGEAAYVMRVSVTTIRRAVDQGDFATVPILGRTLIPAEEIGRYDDRVRSQRRPTPEKTAEVIAQAKITTQQRLKSICKADWNTGEDQIDLDAYLARQAARNAKKKARPPGSS